MSNSTLVSIVPFPIAEFKPGIYPGFFEIKASRNNVPELLVIGDSVFHVEIDENRTITVDCASDKIAKSIVDDYITANLAYSVEKDAAPGFFWLPGKLNLMEVQAKHSSLLESAIARQKRWFVALVEMADDDWEKTRQHKFISDMQRYAAKALGYEKPWIVIPKAEVPSLRCPSCQSFIQLESVVCPQCRCILNIDKYKTLKFAETI